QRTAAALALVVGAAILREGAELVLFLYGLVASGASGADLQAGALAGVGAGALLSGISYFGLAAIPSRYVFSVTSALIIFLAAGLAAQAAQFLSNAGIVTGLDQILWNSSGLIPENGWPGRVLHALVGYTDRPTALQGIVYVGTILVMVGLMQVTASSKRRALRTA
ncbi:iron permease, partial [Methylobacterium sp. WL93]